MLRPTAIIDLECIRHNVKEIKKFIKDDVKFIAVVKSNAYGHGICEVSNAIKNDVDAFAVSWLDEGISLRYSGITKPIIMLLPPSKEEILRAIRHGITLTIDGKDRLCSILKICKRYCLQADINVAVNVGMNRIGIDTKKDLDDVLEILSVTEKYLKLQGIFSHFSNVYDLKTTEIQFEKFINFCKDVKKNFPNTIFHVASSGATLLNKKFQLDAVRIGLMLYGYSPFKDFKIKLKKAMTVNAETVVRRTLNKGENLLYGDFSLNKKTDVKIRAYGYADGLYRKGFYGSLNNTCMDLCATETNGTILSDAEEIANKNQTITYEILCNVSKRCKFIYKGN